MPITFTAPIAQPAMAKATLVAINGGVPLRSRVMTFAELGLTKAGVYNAVAAALGVTGTVT